MAYIEGTNAMAPGDPIGLRIDEATAEHAVVTEVSRFRIAVVSGGRKVEIDLRPCNEATWDKARRHIAERAGVPVA